ncbi:hypothetical protein DES53_1223 [Roseimicrobium gellanilyticum]|uniref:FecR family protein n=1 Tax=Roseimicrobium gellanilyticum TaxID=748857 RepID=A0A366H3G4_9BACT|nr:hypothetical protein [Roseimicrobium gellanilyticum]RBP35336.1 hypothetical protein DES53_1223 [Roseimicrobium gellanilyticum]
MSCRFNPIASCILLLAVLLCASAAQGQVLVYKFDTSDAKGINFHTFEGGYVVAPLLGGDATFLLTTKEDGRQYLESSGGGRLFTAVSGSGDKKAVISASTGLGAAEGALVALGDINHTVKISSPASTITARVAKALHGTLVSADDESDAETEARDGSIGNGGTADVKITLDEKETNRVNDDGLTLAQTVEHLKLELEREGYRPVSGDDGDDDDDDEEEEEVESTE